MITYFCLRKPEEEKLLADPDSYVNTEKKLCPVTSEHLDGNRRIGTLDVTVKHSRRDEKMIWCGAFWKVIHCSLIAEFENQGFTGFRTQPATVRFRDGSVSHDYREFIVTGWAGIALPESGIAVKKDCPACHWKNYSGITNGERVIDWSQWTGEDFFMVWPIPLMVLITERVAFWLLDRGVKSFRLTGFEGIGKNGFSVARLSNFLPEDLAIKYGRPLGLE